MGFTQNQTDSLILAACNPYWTKIAVVMAKVYDAYEVEGIELSDCLAGEISARVYGLINAGRLELQGEREQWEESDVRLVVTHEAAQSS